MRNPNPTTCYYDPAEYTLVHHRYLAKLQRGFDGLVSRVSRLEVIDENGRVYSRWHCDVDPSLQDDGRTLKLFVRAVDVRTAEAAVDPHVSAGGAADTGTPSTREANSSSEEAVQALGEQR